MLHPHTTTIPTIPGMPLRPTPNPQRNLLLVSACALGSLLAFQLLANAPPIVGSSTAQAGMVASTGQHVMMTADASNEDLLLVLDGRSEELFVYRTDVTKGIQVFQRVPLSQLFGDAKARSGGR